MELRVTTSNYDMFTPFELGGLTLKNRFIKAATHDGGSFEAMERTYCRLAQNGVALLTVRSNRH